MRKIVAGLFQTLDGVVESPQEWQLAYFNDEMGREIGAQRAAADTMLLGRRTYQEFAAYWPHQPSQTPFADYMNTTPKLVVSTTLDTIEWQNSTLISGDVVAELTKLTQQPGKNLNITGSVSLVRSLLREGLLDELRVMICPIVLGSGRRLVEDGGGQVPLRLGHATTFSTGVLSLTSTPADKLTSTPADE